MGCWPPEAHEEELIMQINSQKLNFGGPSKGNVVKERGE